METFFGSLESSGGYANIAGGVLVGVFWLSKQVIQGGIARAQGREVETKRDFEAQLERERMNQAALHGMTDKVITALDNNTRVISTVIETTRATNERLEALDRHLSRDQGRDSGGR